jgi:hypothetical protein
MKKGKVKKNYFKNFIKDLKKIVGYATLAMVVIYLVTDFAMTTQYAQYLQYIHLNAELATYIHHEMALPFAACISFYVLATLDK